MKIKYLNTTFNYKNHITLNKRLFVKKILVFSMIMSVSLIGCSKHKNVSEEISENIVIENVESSINSTELTVSNNNLLKEIDSEEISTLSTDQEPIEQKEKKLVAITFDDGPSKYTSELVDILTSNGANATFFLIGKNINNYSDSVVKAYQAGNEIGVHTYSHKSFSKMTIEEIQNELNKTRSLLDNIDVEYSNIVRPPYGSINEEIQNSIDTSFILWNVDTEDWKSKDKDAVIAEVKKNISDGSIILFHDIYPSTIEAISEVLPELTNEYEFVTVSALFSRNDKILEENEKYYKVKK